MGVQASNVSHINQAEELHSTHNLDGSSGRQCQQYKSSRGAAQHSLSGQDFRQAMSAMEIKHRSCTALTRWMGFQAGSVSHGNQAQELHSTHTLDGISGRQCQPWKSSRGAALHSHPGWDYRQAISAMEIKQRSCTALTSWMGLQEGNVSHGNQAEELHSTHILDGITERQCQPWKSSRGAALHSHPGWMGFQEGNVSHGNQAEDMYSNSHSR
jgi:hypothetical protein